MLRHDKSAPIWLFSFVDLAFLLLIAFTQVGPVRDRDSTHFAELEVPQIVGQGNPLASRSSTPLWQLRIHPASPSDETQVRKPFELIEPDSSPSDPAQVIDTQDLAARLRLLHDRATAKPVLTPHRDSRSEDLLIAVSLLEEVWQNARTVAVRPGPAVASGPNDEAL